MGQENGRSGLQAYDFKHMSLDLYIVRTNLNPRTIMRSPGFVNSVMVSVVIYALA